MSIGFPGSSARKESACNAGETSLIPVSGRFTGEGIGYPLQYSWASLVAQLVKNLPAIRDTWVQSPGEGNPPPGIHLPQDPRILPGRTVKKVREEVTWMQHRCPPLRLAQAQTPLVPGQGGDNKSYSIRYQQLLQNKEIFSKVMVAQ